MVFYSATGAEKMKIYDKIRFMRQQQHLSQEDMAEKLQMSVNGYANIERGETDVQISRLEEIATIFGVDLMELFSFGEKNVIFIGGNVNDKNIFSQDSIGAKELASELQKSQIIIEKLEQEIFYLKKIISLMEKDNNLKC